MSPACVLFLWHQQGYLQNLGTTKRSNMKKNTFKVWKQTFSELDFETLRLISAGLGISPSARHHRPAGRNEPYYPIEDCKTRCLTTFFLCVYRLFLLYWRGEQPLSQLVSSVQPRRLQHHHFYEISRANSANSFLDRYQSRTTKMHVIFLWS